MKEADRWYQKAAEQGHKEAKAALPLMMINAEPGENFYRQGQREEASGRGFQAAICYRQAAAMGHITAANRLKLLEKEMKKQTPEQIIRKLLKQMPDMGKGYDRWSVESDESKTWLDKLGNNLLVPYHEKKLAARDRTTSWFSSGKEGWILTDKGIHSYFGNRRNVTWEEFARSEVSWGAHLILNSSNHISGINSIDKPFFTKLHEELRKQLLI